MLDYIERMERAPAEVVGWARPHLENMVPANGFPQDHQRLMNQYRAVFQQRIDIMLRNAEKVESKEEWISAASTGLIVLPDPIFGGEALSTILKLSEEQHYPAIYPFRSYAQAGGLLSYGINIFDQVRRSAFYVDQILKGARPGDLPVQAPTKFELTINLKTARALGLDVPQTLLARADEVIE